MGNRSIFYSENLKMPKQVQKKKAEKTKNTSGLFQKTPKNLRIGGTVQPARDLTRFVRWPRYILLQRQRQVLYQRLRVPPSINQFSKTLTSNQSKNLWRLLGKYTPEAKKDKVARLKDAAEKKQKGDEVKTAKPHTLKFGLNHVTSLVENGEAKLVVIAHDVDPIELVLWLPNLCRSKGIPYVIVKDKARLGRVCRQSTASCVALTSVKNEDKSDLDKITQMAKTEYLESPAAYNTWGTPVMGIKARHKIERIQALKQAEVMRKN